YQGAPGRDARRVPQELPQEGTGKLGLARLHEFLARHRRIGIDTCVFIYHFEENREFLHLAKPVLAWVEKPGHSAVTSTVTLTELLTFPYRELPEIQVRAFLGLLTTVPNLEWIAPDLSTAASAARVRAEHGLRTPDAIQAATAIRSGATGFITNDAAFR